MEETKTSIGEALIQRRTKEFALAKSIPGDFRLHWTEVNNTILIQVEYNILGKKISLDKSIKSINFDIILDHNFPITSPKIQTVTNFSKPSLADGRELVAEILGKKWEITNTLAELIEKIPSFIQRYVEETAKHGRFRMVGEFHIGQKYDINDWMTMSTCSVFQCQCNVPEFEGKPLYIVISETIFLVLTPEEKRKNYCTLLQWTTLQSLSGIHRDMDVPNRVVLTWYKANWRDSFAQEYTVEKDTQFVNFLVLQLEKLGAGVDRNIRNKHKFRETEVTDSSVKKTNIDKIVAKIEESENILNKNLTYDNMQALIAQYQQAIEYYSALGNDKFELYLNKMQDLMKRPDIQACMDSGPS